MRLIFLVVAFACLLLGCSIQLEQAQDTRYQVVISGSLDNSSINGIKGIREVTGLGLAEAKVLFDNMPSVVKADLTKEDAEAIAERLRASSLIVEIQEN